jgi:hypothetical protein
MRHVLLLRFEGTADHDSAAAALKRALPNLRWIAAYDVEGAYDAVDIVDLPPGEDPEKARRALAEANGVEAECLPAESSAIPRAPG